MIFFSRYEQIFTDMHVHKQMLADMRIFAVCSVMYTDINRYLFHMHNWNIGTETRYVQETQMNRCRRMKKYGQTLTIFTDTNIWTDIYMLIYWRLLTYTYTCTDIWQILTDINDIHRCKHVHILTYLNEYLQIQTDIYTWTCIERYWRIFQYKQI